MGTACAVRVDIAKLYRAVEDKRKDTGDSLIDVGAVTGVQRRVMTKLRAAGLGTIEYRPSGDVLLSLCDWLDRSPADFGVPNENAGEVAVQVGWRPRWEKYDDCPTCGVPPQVQCVRVSGADKGTPMLYPHPRRRRLESGRVLAEAS